MSEDGNVKNPLIPLLLAGLIISSTAAISNILVSIYNIVNTEQNAELAVQARIKEDERFKTLMAENEKLLTEVTRIADGVRLTSSEIVAKLDQVIQTMIQQDFATVSQKLKKN
uniref:TMhelix containing protein n=1 Tax=Panagrolaimus davidi TaxID=227884 RepID=A0A914QUB2_9BILA